VNAWKPILAALIIFAAGVITGGLIAPAKPEPSGGAQPAKAPLPMFPQHRVEYLRRLQRQLDLTPDQRTRIEQHLSASQERLKTMWAPMAPAAREEARQVRRQILEELTPEQRKKFEETFNKPKGHKGNGDLKSRRFTNNQPASARE
jgi:Spy/CpxP family protein refolding chaperone